MVVVLLAAAVAGFLARRLVHGTRSPEHPLARAEGVTVSELVVPARTLAALVLAFVVVSVYDSFVDAQAQTAAEAGAVLRWRRALARHSGSNDRCLRRVDVGHRRWSRFGRSAPE